VFSEKNINNFLTEVQDFFLQPNAFRSVLILVISLLAAYWISKYLAKSIVKVAQIVASHSDNESNEERAIRLRQIETYLSVTVAIVRAVTVAIVGYIAWRVFSPASSSSTAAALGASAFIVVFLGQTLGMLLRDITAGATMIVERWFNVGDFIKIEPFADVSGVVERFTLRSTRLRSLSGEIIWVHNQQMMAVHVTPRGVRTMAVDVFVHDREAGEKAVRKIINTVPSGPMMLAKPLKIKTTEKWDEDIWRITVEGQMLPGREWLVEKYFVNALKEIDADKKRSERLIIHEPIPRWADPEADRRFKRAIRIKKDKTS
jgi:small-conductance mechanosensitive channel